MAADSYNDAGSAPLHLVGFDLDPPARITRIREKEREKKKLWENEQKADREARLIEERRGPALLRLSAQQGILRTLRALDARNTNQARYSADYLRAFYAEYGAKFDGRAGKG